MSSIIEVAKSPTIAYNDKNWERIQSTMAQGFVYDEVATGRKFQGVEDTLTGWRGWAAALPDSTATFHSAVSSGNTVILELTWHGTQTGPLQTPTGTLPPTGRSVEMRACQIVEVDGDQVKSMRHYFDMATMMRQLGHA
jgi:steroid delta-isomerase-like uncharacterized protein